MRASSRSSVKKGDVLKRWLHSPTGNSCIDIVPLFLPNQRDELLYKLPRYNHNNILSRCEEGQRGWNEKTFINCTDLDTVGNTAIKQVVSKTLATESRAGYAVAVTLHSVLCSNIDIASLQLPNDGNNHEVEENSQFSQKIITEDVHAHELLLEAWILCQNVISSDMFSRLYQKTCAGLNFVDSPHPLQQYAKQTLLELDEKDAHVACAVLRNYFQQESNLSPSSPSSQLLFWQLLISEQCAPRRYAILLDAATSAVPRHSCLPNAAWELIWNHVDDEEQFQVHLIALYNIAAGEELFISLVDTSLPLDQRETSLRKHLSNPRFVCNCAKCEFQRETTTTTESTTRSVREWERLGHAALQEQNFQQSRRCYRHCLALDPSLADIHHALGAVSLQQGRFVQAQREWRDAATHNAALLDHEGIRLQIEKQRAYRYFEERPSATTSSADFPSYTSHFNGLCFVTDEPVASLAECRQVIDWASQQKWTTGRHYAVPTHDVPVHTVAPLCEWFVDWMSRKGYPLLARHFRGQPNHFYVHDAFVVRYNAAQSNNYLPLHFDESTHSMVLALNNGFEGGGTLFVDYGKVLAPKRPGTLVTFRGDKLRHGGNTMTSGVRYILAVFLYHDKDESHTALDDKELKRPSLQELLRNYKKQREDTTTEFSFGFSL